MTKAPPPPPGYRYGKPGETVYVKKTGGKHRKTIWVLLHGYPDGVDVITTFDDPIEAEEYTYETAQELGWTERDDWDAEFRDDNGFQKALVIDGDQKWLDIHETDLTPGRYSTSERRPPKQELS